MHIARRIDPTSSPKTTIIMSALSASASSTPAPAAAPLVSTIIAPAASSSSSSASSASAQPATELMPNSIFRSDTSWPICEPEFVVQQLKQLPATDCKNGKLFYKSYGPYSKLTDTQKNKVQEFFDSQSDEVKRRVHDGALNSSTTYNNDSNARAETTNKDDRARLLQLSQYPEAQTFWTATKNPLDREELDDDNVTTLTAYRSLAGIFNDYPNL
jgi:hypothetical protein